MAQANQAESEPAPAPLDSSSLSAAQVLAICPACAITPTCFHAHPTRAGILECDGCGEYSSNGGHVARCFDCDDFERVLDLTTSEHDDKPRCDGCHEEHLEARARVRREEDREAAWDMALDASKEGRWAR